MEANTESKHDKQCITITLCSTKGGSGKTTLAANLGGLLAGLNPNHKVFLIDGDLQPTLSGYYPITEKADHGLVELVKSIGDPLDTISKKYY